MSINSESWQEQVTKLEQDNKLLRKQIRELKEALIMRAFPTPQRDSEDGFYRGMPGHPGNEMGM